MNKTKLEWVRLLDKLFNGPRPKLIDNARWKNICTKGRVLLYPKKGAWLENLATSWTVEDIFSCHRSAPLQRYEAQGLLLLLSEGNLNITDVGLDVIELKSERGAVQKHYPISAKRTRIPEDWTTLLELDAAPLGEKAERVNISPPDPVSNKVLTYFALIFGNKLKKYKAEGLHQSEACERAMNEIMLHFMESVKENKEGIFWPPEKYEKTLTYTFMTKMYELTRLAELSECTEEEMNNWEKWKPVN